MTYVPQFTGSQNRGKSFVANPLRPCSVPSNLNSWTEIFRSVQSVITQYSSSNETSFKPGIPAGRACMIYLNDNIWCLEWDDLTASVQISRSGTDYLKMSCFCFVAWSSYFFTEESQYYDHTFSNKISGGFRGALGSYLFIFTQFSGENFQMVHLAPCLRNPGIRCRIYQIKRPLWWNPPPPKKIESRNYFVSKNRQYKDVNVYKIDNKKINNTHI